MTPSQWIEHNFPRLAISNAYEPISPVDQDYNCIAYAAGDTQRWWEPPSPFRGGTYWPPGAPAEITIEAYVAAFQTLGYQPCEDGDPEDGIEKVALFQKDGLPTHAARQSLDTGSWESKLGQGYDITHEEVDGVGGSDYGEPVIFMSRPLQP
ncbi:MAG: hypothetical protein GY701_31660 [Sulfitobacter sp.]|nr:hypothetical protein [Sulfitobacter sp.]